MGAEQMTDEKLIRALQAAYEQHEAQIAALTTEKGQLRAELDLRTVELGLAIQAGVSVCSRLRIKLDAASDILAVANRYDSVQEIAEALHTALED